MKINSVLPLLMLSLLAKGTTLPLLKFPHDCLLPDISLFAALYSFLALKLCLFTQHILLLASLSELLDIDVLWQT